MAFFTTLHRSSKSSARKGVIQTKHGSIQTPAFVPVATKGTLKSLLPQLLAEIKVQVAFVNTYHLVTHPGSGVVKEAGGIHTYSRLPVPLMSDSGGFQVFSLAKEKQKAAFRGTESVAKGAMPADDTEALVEKISEEGVIFRSTYDGSTVEFTPETSMRYQREIGADLIMAFDECTYYPATEEYARRAMERTHRWLTRCIAEFGKEKGHQHLYGIIQGGTYEKLRRESAQFVVAQPTDGIAIGGVSVGESKEEMREQVAWVAEYLPEDRPVHLLGIGHADDIRDLVTVGIDTFDCVEPTRLARMGYLYQSQSSEDGVDHWEKIDVNKITYRESMEKVDENCSCYVCTNFTKSYLHHLFKQRELLGYTLATYHNLWVMEQFMGVIRSRIERDML